MKEPILKEVHIFCPVCKTHETIETYRGNLDGRMEAGVMRQGKFYQEGFYIYHCKGKPVMEVK